ncbi:competence/damage-inducible protein-like protein cinA [Lophiotrema nucula]|uniref:Competence/damage-inducible protein-like protein cinA n=1 Tax=Lophiotrema nucula TaxID=690887 RepID=A0A6A5Z9E2_9PLEO|nr:competence/damage-inducible protein-like protein cinA [Lophiotrema nucula]
MLISLRRITAIAIKSNTLTTHSSNRSNLLRTMSTFPPEPLREIVQEVATLLKERKETISVAETAAGGLISATLLSFPGASGYYKGGLTLYTLESRIAFAGWTEANKVGYKGPTPDIVAGLADHTRKTLGSTYTVSESGTAGPAGGTTKNRTPGYVALAVSSEKGTTTREVDTGKGTDREANMVAFAVEGLKLVRDVIKGEGKL